MEQTYRATLTVTSSSREDAPFRTEIEYDPPLDLVIADGEAPTSYQFMSLLVEKHILPVLAWNERYEAMLAAEEAEENGH